MINLTDKFCKLETGEIEPLQYSNGEPRMAYEDGEAYYLDHDVAQHFMGRTVLAYRHDLIIATANSREELE